MNVRKMKVEDIDEIRKLDSLVFSAHRKDMRKSENILSNLKLNPEGCFVFEKNEIIGYVFSHIWGELAWIGTFGIHPGHQGKGIGKKLFENVLDFLNKQGCSIIGLETFSDSPYNIGMYLQLGFNPVYPTLIFKKLLNKNDSSTEIGLSEENNIDIVSKLSKHVLKGLDYASEAQSALKDGWGKVLFFGINNPLGFAILRFSPTLEGQPENSAIVHTMIINSDSEEIFLDSLRKVEAFTEANDFKELIIPVNSINCNVVQWLLKYGYKLQNNFIRMVYKGKYQELRGVDLSRWAM
jgi:ribosomal protein S18 acetylase RimI-like enzyme